MLPPELSTNKSRAILHHYVKKSKKITEKTLYSRNYRVWKAQKNDCADVFC